MRCSTLTAPVAASIIAFTQISFATMPTETPGEFEFPGNFRALAIPPGTTAGKYAQKLNEDVEADTKLTDEEKTLQKKRIEYARADFSYRYNNTRASYAENGNVEQFTCTKQQYDLAKTAFKEAIYLAEKALAKLKGLQQNPSTINSDLLFRQIFADLLPEHQMQFQPSWKDNIPPKKVKTPETAQAKQAMQQKSLNHVIKVFDRVVELKPFLTSQIPAMKALEGSDDPSWIKFACMPKCGSIVEYAFVAPGKDVINLCPKFFTPGAALMTIPRNGQDTNGMNALCKANSGLGIGKRSLMASGAATILHELQHTKWIGDYKQAETLWSDDYGYGIHAILDPLLKMIPKKNLKGSILNLTPQQAIKNADSYAWYALLNVRRELCNLSKIGNFDRLSCFKRWGLKLSETTDTLVGEERDPAAPEGECGEDQCTMPSGSTGNIRRSLDGRAAICCLKGNRAVETKDPRTGKTEMDCVPETPTCPAGQIVTTRTDPKTKRVTTTCTCPPGQITTTKTDPNTKKPTTVCTCPAGQSLQANKNPKTGKTTTVCACPAGQKAVTAVGRRTRKKVTSCVPVGGTKPPAPKKQTAPQQKPISRQRAGRKRSQ